MKWTQSPHLGLYATFAASKAFWAGIGDNFIHEDRAAMRGRHLFLRDILVFAQPVVVRQEPQALQHNFAWCRRMNPELYTDSAGALSNSSPLLYLT